MQEIDPDAPLLRRLHDVAMPFDGCVTPTLLKSVAISDATADSLVRRGALTRVCPRVSLVGARELSDRQLLWAAVLAAGPGAMVSHRTAAALHGLLEPEYGAVWVTQPGRRKTRRLVTQVPLARTGERAHVWIAGSRSARVAVRTLGLPVEAVAGTMVRIAGCLPTSDVLAAWREADYRNKLRESELRTQMGRGIGGSTVIDQLLRAHPIVSDDATEVVTPQEFALLAAVLRAGLPRPLTNAPLRLPGALYFPDLYWHLVGLVVEVDGGIHQRAKRRAADSARDAHMKRHGLTVVRVSNDEVDSDPDAAALRVVRHYHECLAAR